MQLCPAAAGHWRRSDIGISRTRRIRILNRQLGSGGTLTRSQLHPNVKFVAVARRQLRQWKRHSMPSRRAISDQNTVIATALDAGVQLNLRCPARYPRTYAGFHITVAQ